jgi:hypothetical protein
MKKINNKKIVIFIFLFVFLLLFLVQYFLNYNILFNKEKMSNLSTKSVELTNWWGDDEASQKVFNYLFDNFQNQYDKIKIYSVFGSPNIIKDENELNIQYSGESYYNEPSSFDINFIPTDEKNNNNITFPLSCLYILNSDTIDVEKLLNKRIYNNYNYKTNFCLFAVSNSSCQQRNNMFTELSKYKRVDSCGKFMNNMDKSCPGNFGSPEYFDFISNYKFMICFENTSQPNYFTEKLINAYYGGAIPIYWGCSNLSDYVNMDSLLYLPKDYSENQRVELIEKIKYLDNNDDAYRKMYEQCFFKNGELPDEFNIEKIKQKISNVLSK